MCVCVFVCVRVRVCLSVYCVCMSMHVCMHVHIHVYVRKYVCNRKDIHSHIEGIVCSCSRARIDVVLSFMFACFTLSNSRTIGRSVQSAFIVLNVKLFPSDKHTSTAQHNTAKPMKV